MPSTRSTIKRRKSRSPSLEARARSHDWRVADVSPRTYIDTNTSRSMRLKRNSENRAIYLTRGTKRKLETLKDSPETSVAGPLKPVSSEQQREHKFPKYTHPAPTSMRIGQRKASKIPTYSREKRVNHHAVQSLSSQFDVTPGSNGTKLEPARRTASAKGSDHESRGSTQAWPEAEDLKERLVESQKETYQARKAIQEQRKAVEDLKKELAASKRMSRKQGNQIDKLKTTNKKSEDQLSLIKENLQCQICLEILTMPHTLVPCGHAFCQGCLQTWFRNAPRQEEGFADILEILRIKTCPCCRSRIRSRPIPLFILKDVLSTFAEGDQTVNKGASVNVDPWEDIFLPEVDVTESEFTDLDETDDDNSNEDSSSSITDYIGIRYRIYSDFDDSGSQTEDEDDETSSVDSGSVRVMRPPPRVAPRSSRDEMREIYPHVSRQLLQLLRRGATPLMIERYRMRIEPIEGIVAWTRRGTEIYLGWNIRLRNDDAPDGRDFMLWVERNVRDDPESWSYELSDSDGHAVYKRLVHHLIGDEVLMPTSDDDSVDGDEDTDEESD